MTSPARQLVAWVGAAVFAMGGLFAFNDMAIPAAVCLVGGQVLMWAAVKWRQWR